MILRYPGQGTLVKKPNVATNATRKLTKRALDLRAKGVLYDWIPLSLRVCATSDCQLGTRGATLDGRETGSGFRHWNCSRFTYTPETGDSSTRERGESKDRITTRSQDLVKDVVLPCRTQLAPKETNTDPSTFTQP